MPQFDDAQLTESVLKSFASAPDPRLRTVLTALVKHLHGFVRDVDLTLDEWLAAIDFLNRTGHKSDATRQEFILLSDVLGVSMLVDALNHRSQTGATDTTVLGPFYVGEHRVTPNGTDLARDASGERVFVDAGVTDVTGKPIAGATVDVWHADRDGLYDSQKPDYRLDAPWLRARFVTGDDGRFWFRTVAPNSYPIPMDGPVGELMTAARRSEIRPAHIHFLLAAPGFETLVTHLFVAGDDYLERDAVFGVKPSLIVRLESRDDPTTPDGKAAPPRWLRMPYQFAMKSVSQ